MSNKIKCSHILVEKHSEAISLLERIQKGESKGLVKRSHPGLARSLQVP